MIQELIKERDELVRQESRLYSLFRRIDNGNARIESTKVTFWSRVYRGEQRVDQLTREEAQDFREYLEDRLHKVKKLRLEKEKLIDSAEQVLKQAQL